jgi:hypothetical protein
MERQPLKLIDLFEKKPKRCKYIIVVSLLLAMAIPIAVAADEATDSSAAFSCRPWEAAQGMFYSDPYWRGGDCASTVDLGDGRVLWLFADSYVGVKPPYRRDYCCVKMIRNCMGIQHGYDPSTADFAVYWRGTKDEPRPFFPNEDTSWFWPGNAVRIDSMLAVFLMRVCHSDSGLSFKTCGHAAFLISDLEDDPGNWTVSWLQLPDNPFGIMLGAATIVEPPYLYAFSVKEPGDHSMYLARWLTDSVLAGSTEAIEWWTGDSSAWVLQARMTSAPTMLFPDGATELSVVYDARADQYLSIQTVGFGAADVIMRTSPSLTGPWSPLQLVYQPPEKSKPNVIIYAAKAHPEISGADLIITYNTNAPTETIIADTTIYYPRLVRFDWND